MLTYTATKLHTDFCDFSQLQFLDLRVFRGVLGSTDDLVAVVSEISSRNKAVAVGVLLWDVCVCVCGNAFAVFCRKWI